MSLPRPVLDAAGAVAAATRRLVESARVADPLAIERAVEERGSAVEELSVALESAGDAADAGARQTLLESLALEAGEAEWVLRRVIEASRGALQETARGSFARRAYTAYSVDPSSLDRSG